jgi:hypothetical protein
MPPTDLLSALLDLVAAAARKDSVRAPSQHDAPAARRAPPLVDSRATAHAHGGRMTALDPLCRKGRTSSVHGGDIRRLRFETVRSALRPTAPRRGNAPCEERLRDGERMRGRDGRRLNTGRG